MAVPLRMLATCSDCGRPSAQLSSRESTRAADTCGLHTGGGPGAPRGLQLRQWQVDYGNGGFVDHHRWAKDAGLWLNYNTGSFMRDHV